MTSPEKVKVRLRWNAAESVAVAVSALWEFHFRGDAGGVCGALPRAHLSACVWCDHIEHVALGHLCDEASAPHELTVCILQSDNPGPLYGQLCTRARG